MSLILTPDDMKYQ